MQGYRIGFAIHHKCMQCAAIDCFWSAGSPHRRGRSAGCSTGGNARRRTCDGACHCIPCSGTQVCICIQGICAVCCVLKSFACFYHRISPRCLRAKDAVKRLPNAPVPLHLCNAPTPLMKSMGYSEGYQYPPSCPDSARGQQYLPESVRGEHFFEEN